MNPNSPESERSPLDYIHFAVIFYGLWLLAAGALSASIPITVIAALMLGAGGMYFLLTDRTN